MVRKPIIIVNAKTYPETTGKNIFKIAKACEETAKKGHTVGLATQAFDLKEALHITKKTNIYSQHLDNGEPGRNTGYMLAKNVASIGIKHTILNHSEHKISFTELKKTVAECKKLKMTIILCADTPREAKKLVALKPDYIAVEPPGLIGGDVSVSTKPRIIKNSLEAVGKIPLLVGAGIKTGEDVRVALEIGARGVLVASGVVLAKNPKKVLEEFTEL